MTSDGSPYARFRRAIERGHLLGAESAARELATVNLADALDYCDLLAREAPDRYERAALRWHARLEQERPLTLSESALAIVSLQALATSSRATALAVLRHFARRS